MIERTVEFSPAEERRRMKRHPSIVFRDDAAGRRTAAEARAGRPYPRMILTDNHAWPRGNRRTIGRLVNALDALLASGVEVQGEHWLAD